MTSDFLIFETHNISIALISCEQFLKTLPQGFYRDGNRKIRHDPNKVNLFLNKAQREQF